MTEKRFTIFNMGLDGRFIKENGKIMTIERVVDLLNENEQLKSRINDYDVALKKLQDLADKKLKENEQLKQENDWLHESVNEATNFIYDNFEVNRMFTDRELNDICNDMGWELSEKGIKLQQLEKENEQLKKELSHLRYRFTEYRNKKE